MRVQDRSPEPVKISEEGRKVGDWRREASKLRPHSCADTHISNVFVENLLFQDLKFASMFQPLCFDRKVYTFPASQFFL